MLPFSDRSQKRLSVRKPFFPQNVNIPLSRKGPFQKWGSALGFTGIGDVNGLPTVALRQY